MGGMRLPIVFSVVAILSTLSTSSRAGQVSYRKTPATEAHERAAVVVTVKLEAPAMASARIPVALPKGYAPANNFKTPNKKPCGTYDFGAYVGVIEKVHEPTAHAPVKQGERIVMFPSETGALLELTRDACEHGGSKSPIFERMDGGVEPTDGAVLTVLLRWEDTVGWVEAMGGAWLKEPPAPLEKKPNVYDVWSRGDDALCMKDEDCVIAVPPKLDKEGELVCGVCPPCALAADKPMARAAIQRADAMCAKKRAQEGVVATCEACAPTTKRAACKNMRCAKKP